MKFVNRNSYIIVRCTYNDIKDFNATRPARLPTDDDIIIGFEKGSGEVKRFIPQKLRHDGYGLINLARIAGFKWLRKI